MRSLSSLFQPIIRPYLIRFLKEVLVRLDQKNYYEILAEVVAQLVERLLPKPEIRISNPDIGKKLSTKFTIEKTKIKKKRPGMAHL